MRVLLPTSRIEKFDKIIPIIEKRTEVNGKIDRKVFGARRISSDINGIILNEETEYSSCPNNYVIGNLKNETVLEILQLALKNGYVDLSGYDIKEITSEFELYNISTPYIARTFIGVTTISLESDEIELSVL